MARYTGPSCRLCRREGQKMYLKGDRCYTGKCALERRSTAPGQHGAKRGKLSNYGVQLREKQKVKRHYGLLETQFRLTFDRAEKMKGMTGENLLRLLETRLDNVVFKLGFASSRQDARQLVTHGHFLLNGKKADIPSMHVAAGDVVEVKEKSKSAPKFKGISERAVTVPRWLEADADKLVGKVVAQPERSDVDLPIEEHLIVELYSR